VSPPSALRHGTDTASPATLATPLAVPLYYYRQLELTTAPCTGSGEPYRYPNPESGLEIGSIATSGCSVALLPGGPTWLGLGLGSGLGLGLGLG
jgi:hypothetical protein